MLRSPLFWYLSVTLGMPVLGGRLTEPGFVEHAAAVLSACLLVFSVGHLYARLPAVRRRKQGQGRS
jgi:hypothetical protein